MSLTAADLALIKTHATSRFDTELAAVVDQTYLKFTQQDTFGLEGYMPTMLGGLGAAQEWLDTRVMHSMGEYAYRLVGKRYENSVQHKKEHLRLSPVNTAAKIGAALAVDAINFPGECIVKAIKDNAIGLDRDPLFGEHTYGTAVGSHVQVNLITGSGPRWYLMNEYSMIEAIGDPMTMQIYGGDNTSIDFMQDSIAFGWATTAIHAPGFWANSVASEQALTSQNLRTAINMQIGFKNDTGKRIAKKAKYLVVDRETAGAAEHLLFPALVKGGDTNLDKDRLELIILDDL